MEERQKRKALQLRMAELEEAKKEEKRALSRSVVAKREKKKINQMKSAQYQVITNLAKTKKWNRAAKKQLTRLPKELFYEKFKWDNVDQN